MLDPTELLMLQWLNALFHRYSVRHQHDLFLGFNTQLGRRRHDFV